MVVSQMQYIGRVNGAMVGGGAEPGMPPAAAAGYLFAPPESPLPRTAGPHGLPPPPPPPGPGGPGSPAPRAQPRAPSTPYGAYYHDPWYGGAQQDAYYMDDGMGGYGMDMGGYDMAGGSYYAPAAMGWGATADSSGMLSPGGFVPTSYAMGYYGDAEHGGAVGDGTIWEEGAAEMHAADGAAVLPGEAAGGVSPSSSASAALAPADGATERRAAQEAVPAAAATAAPAPRTKPKPLSRTGGTGGFQGMSIRDLTLATPEIVVRAEAEAKRLAAGGAPAPAKWRPPSLEVAHRFRDDHHPRYIDEQGKKQRYAICATRTGRYWCNRCACCDLCREDTVSWFADYGPGGCSTR
jgi:hypothetical protein